jgi:DNA-binding GntR family transcriptional regulator
MTSGEPAGPEHRASKGHAALAYDRIRQAIVEGAYGPGDRLVEQRISEEFSLSRTPVREALRRLESEGLVVFRRNRGAAVRYLSADDVRDLYELRARLESYAAELASVRGTIRSYDAMDEAAEQFERQVGRSGDVVIARDDRVRALSDTNNRFHQTIVAAAGHERLSQMLASAVDVPLVFQALRGFERSELQRSAEFHRMTAHAIRRGEGARAGRLMSEHILLGRDRLMEDLERGEGARAGNASE